MVAGIRWWIWAIGAAIFVGLVFMVGYNLGRFQRAASVPPTPPSVTAPVVQKPSATTPAPVARPVPTN